MASPEPATPADLAARIKARDRRALARAITLVESTRTDHQDQADALLEALLPATGAAIRLGISGAPGVGKSTFIEAFGLDLIKRGRRVAVLAVDPSSKLSGGAILGDKTRMADLARDANAFIRPSAAGTTLGGVARRTREAMLVCEAAGFDVVIIETVGVGQSETAVADLVDMFALLLAPAGGDELQGIKKGIVELADLILVNKADGDLAAAAGRTVSDYAAAMPLIRPPSAGWMAPVLAVSALEHRGLGEVWAAVTRFRDQSGTARIAARRAVQAVAWMWNEIDEALRARLRGSGPVAELLPSLESKVSQGVMTPGRAARQALGRFMAAADGT